MSRIMPYTSFISLFIVLISTNRYSDALANHAVYTIENLVSKQCLSAGGVMRSSNKSSISLFKQGQLIMKPCSDTSSLNTTDFSQQWLIKIKKENPRILHYLVQLEMLNALYYDAKLNAEVRGEFIMYFPDEVDLRAREPPDEATQSQVFSVSDSTTQSCLADGTGIEETGAQYMKCEDREDLQKWNFTIVSEKLLLQPGLMMNSSNPLH